MPVLFLALSDAPLEQLPRELRDVFGSAAYALAAPSLVRDTVCFDRLWDLVRRCRCTYAWSFVGFLFVSL
jgi:hypothetical protein